MPTLVFERFEIKPLLGPNAVLKNSDDSNENLRHRYIKYEVNYVLRHGKFIWAIEVKSGRRRAVDGLSAFIENYPNAKAVLITRENYPEFEIDPISYLQR